MTLPNSQDDEIGWICMWESYPPIDDWTCCRCDHKIEITRPPVYNADNCSCISIAVSRILGNGWDISPENDWSLNNYRSSHALSYASSSMAMECPEGPERETCYPSHDWDSVMICRYPHEAIEATDSLSSGSQSCHATSNHSVAIDFHPSKDDFPSISSARTSPGFETEYLDGSHTGYDCGLLEAVPQIRSMD